MKRISITVMFIMMVAFHTIADGASRPINERDIRALWPFTVSSGVLSCTPGRVITFTANGTVYAVNGEAAFRGYVSIEPIWKLDWRMYEETARILRITVEEARERMGPVRINIHPIINKGAELC